MQAIAPLLTVFRIFLARAGNIATAVQMSALIGCRRRSEKSMGPLKKAMFEGYERYIYRYTA